MRYSKIALTKNQIKLILDTAKADDPDLLYPLIKTLALTGARVSEVVRLKKQNIDFDNLKLHLPDKNSPTFFRIVNISQDLADVLRERVKITKAHFIFLDRSGHPISSSNLTHITKLFRDENPLGLYWSPAMLRTSFAFHYMNDGGNLFDLHAIQGMTTFGSIKEMQLAEEELI